MDSDDLDKNRNPESLSDLTGGSEEEDEPTKRFTLDLPQSLHEWLKRHALLEKKTSMKEVTVKALREYRRNHSQA